MKRLLILPVVLIVIGISAFASALDFKNVGAEELKKMIDAKKTVVVDARPAEEFQQGHIPGSINVPPEKVGGISGLLPKNKKSQVVFYCRGAG